ncbi:MAG: hypothetical protein ACK5PS_13060 [Desulfopila sp.]
MMYGYQKIVVVVCLVLGLCLTPVLSPAETAQGWGGEPVAAVAFERGSAVAANEEPAAGPEVLAADALLVRPLGVVATLCGTVVFLVASPFAAMGGNSQEVWDVLVADPARFTFQRPLGSFADGDDS